MFGVSEHISASARTSSVAEEQRRLLQTLNCAHTASYLSAHTHFFVDAFGLQTQELLKACSKATHAIGVARGFPAVANRFVVSHVLRADFISNSLTSWNFEMHLSLNNLTLSFF